MANSVNQNRPVVQPRLPAAPVQYDPQFIEQYTNVLRLYFTQLDNLTGAISGSSGGRFFSFPYGSWHDTTTQSAAANTATVITFNATDFSQDITLASSSRITATYSGVYNIIFRVQLSNNNTIADNVSIWFKLNGTNVAASTVTTTCPAISAGGWGGITPGSVPGALVSSWDEIFQLNAGDYLELYWVTANGTTTLAPYAAGVSPAYPASPSVAVSAQFVSALLT